MRTRLRDRSRAAGKRAHGIAAKLRSRGQLGRDQDKDSVQRITGELADLAEAAVRGAQRVLVHARRALRRAQAKAAKLGEAGVHDPAEGRRGRATGPRRQRPVRPAASHRQSSPGRPGNGAPGPPLPPRLRNWWGSSALVITDSRVSFSDARICVAASPYVTRHRAQRGPDPGRCCP